MTTKTSGTPYRYTAALANELEPKWQRWWDEQGTYRLPNPGDADFDASKEKFFGLDMFPYPSGAGLHVGHPLSYTAQDIVCRFHRMTGKNVLRATGWDAFGLPAEQYAIQTGVHPAVTTREAIDNFRRVLQRFGFCYDWSREFATIDEDYYRWTQWIFLQIYNSWFDPRVDKARPIAELISALESGELDADGTPWSELDDDARYEYIANQRLAYVGEQTVNWCPKLGTALANEEVINGRSERGGFPVVRKPLKQWLFRITKYADRLIDGLADIDWPESTRIMQTEWIGRSEGAEIDFPLKVGGHLRVYTTRPDTIFGATWMVVAPEHPLVENVTDPTVRAYIDEARNRSDLERMESKEKTGVDTGLKAINPATGEEIPVWVADYVLMGYGHGAIMAVPAGDERDFEFAEKFGLPVIRVVLPPDGSEPDGCYSGEGIACNSANAEVSLDDLPTPEAKQRIIAWLAEKDLGRAHTNYRLRDWLFSRQRYWGEPFPVVWDDRGRHYAVGDESLPVALPELEDFHPEESDDPQPMLAKAHDWVDTTAGAVGVTDLPADTPVHRETNTMPGWAGSCWYYLRYADPRNADRFVGKEQEAYWMNGNGVDLYIGGAEHATLHLLYARFWHQVIYDLGHVSSPEPFHKMFHQGMITGFAYQRADKSLVPIDKVEERDDGTFFETETGDEVTQTIAKMSKSLRNVVNPDDVIAEYGADTFRLYQMFMGPLEDSKPWNTRDTVGMFRFLQRVWRTAVNEKTGESALASEADPKVERLLHKTIATVGKDLASLNFNTAIARMIELTNAAGGDGLTHDQMHRFIRLLAPFAPHVAEEIWHRMGEDDSVCKAAWPSFDEAMLKDDEVEIVVQVMGKVKSRIMVATDATGEQMEQAALADERIQKEIAGKTVRKVITVPKRLVNIVAN